MTQYGHAGQHHGTGAPGCPVDLHHHHDERCEPPELVDRRQRAAEAFDDAWSGQHAMSGPKGWAERLLAARSEAIETATRVRIDHGVIMAFMTAPGDDPDDIAGPLRAAFRAAGFEVEQ